MGVQDSPYLDSSYAVHSVGGVLGGPEAQIELVAFGVVMGYPGTGRSGGQAGAVIQRDGLGGAVPGRGLGCGVGGGRRRQQAERRGLGRSRPVRNEPFSRVSSSLD